MGGSGIVVQPRSCAARSSSSSKVAPPLPPPPSPPPKKRHQERRWPLDALQAMEAQMGMLQRRGGGGGSEESSGGSSSRLPTNNAAAIDLRAEPPLPQGWEQFLDLNTGEVYYIDWSSCKRTHRDPRELMRSADAKVRALREEMQERHAAVPTVVVSCSSCSSSSHEPFHKKSDVDDEEADDATSQLCSSSRVDHCQDEDEDENVMVALGCHRCLTYFMLPSLDPSCPSCGALLQVKIS